MSENEAEWTVQKPARELKAGDRIIFAEELGGENEVVTVEVVAAIMGGVMIHTEELDFAIGTQSFQWITVAPEEPQEFKDKRQSLAMFLLAMATGQTWEDAEGVDDFHANYTADADEILRQNPHLLSLATREQMGLPT